MLTDDTPLRLVAANRRKLNVRCPNCMHAASFTLTLLVKHCGGWARYGNVKDRLVCSSCGNRLVEAWLV